MTNRTVLSLTGNDRVDFLQGLITQDVAKAKDAIIYAALLTPQGKYIADFFVIGETDRLIIDVAAELAPALAQRLTMYRLRADVQIKETSLIVSRGIGKLPAGAFPDPRSDAMGWRTYGETDFSEQIDWDAMRVSQQIPASNIELTANSYILEMGFERLNGVDFRKGCFVGQEIVARMKHKTTLRKGLALVSVSGKAAAGDEITKDGKPVGTLHTIAGDRALAYLRLDRAEGELKASEAILTRLDA
jgi:folate-binding protein YgfZ